MDWVQKSMTQHEYIFITVSIILGLAITRLLHTVAMLIRAQRHVVFHWSTALWALCVMVYILQLWWVGWGLRDVPAWTFASFVVLVLGSIFIYGAAEMALPVPESDDLDMLKHSQKLGRLSAVSMLAYFLVGPYVNLTMYDYPILPVLVLPGVGMALMLGVILMPLRFPLLTVLFSIYSAVVVALTI